MTRKQFLRQLGREGWTPEFMGLWFGHPELGGKRIGAVVSRRGEILYDLTLQHLRNARAHAAGRGE
jgi:hypothetical protein